MTLLAEKSLDRRQLFAQIPASHVVRDHGQQHLATFLDGHPDLAVLCCIFQEDAHLSGVPAAVGLVFVGTCDQERLTQHRTFLCRVCLFERESCLTEDAAVLVWYKASRRDLPFAVFHSVTMHILIFGDEACHQSSGSQGSDDQGARALIRMDFDRADGEVEQHD